MRLSKKDIDAKIVELYRSGRSFIQLQKRYHKSPNYIAKLVKGIDVTCTACGKPKGKVRFHAHHPDRLNRPDYTVPFCPSCHAREEAKLRRKKENISQSPSNVELPIKRNVDSNPSAVPFSFPREPFSSREKIIITGLVIARLAEVSSPGFFGRRWQEIKDHWRRGSS